MFDKVWAHSKRIALFENIAHLVEWDQETYMPKGAAQARAEQIELLASVAHKEKNDPTFIENVHKLGKGLEPWQKAAVREWKEEIRKAQALPNDFVKAFAKLTSEALIAWQEARREDNFTKFAPFLKKIVEMNRKQADYLGYEESPYDALMDLYEPGLKVSMIQPLFYKLGPELRAILEKTQEHPQIDNSCLKHKVSDERQLDFGNKILKSMGYDLNHGRLDLSTHPFSTSMHPTDNRVTTRINPDSIFDSLSAVLHEGGHGLYEMGLNPDYFGTPVGESRSLGIHESQSRFWETLVGQSYPFWQHFYPLLQKAYKISGSLDSFYRAINRVSPSFIRVESDEVTYGLHVILRFELEKALIEGEMEAEEIPEAWNHMMETLLGITPPTDRQGCLQDIHWSMGAFGYFPTYALGSIYAAQFFEAFVKVYPNWEKHVAKGELLFIRDWQKEHIHKWGKMFSTEELVKNVTGKSITTKPYLTYLEKKYASIYK